MPTAPILCPLQDQMRFSLAAFLATSLAGLAYGQSFHTITVGIKGSFYDPPTTNALEGDIITFVFGGLSNTVTQSSFDHPCSPLPGGFGSGDVGPNGNTSIPLPTWNITVTNASESIWFFCEGTQPESHCAAGMVGAINAPVDMFLQFQAAAKAVTGTPSPVPAVALTGVGAFATASPTTAPVLISSVSESQSLESSSTIPATPSTTSSEITTKKGVSVGPIVGGVVAGLIVVAIIIFLLILLRRHKSRAILGAHIVPREEGQPPSILESGSNGQTSRLKSRIHRRQSSDLSPDSQRRDGGSAMMTTAPFTSNIVFRGDDHNRTVQNQRTDAERIHDPIMAGDMHNLSAISRPYVYTQYDTERNVGSTNIVNRDANNIHELAKEVVALLGSRNPLPSGPPSRSPIDSDHSQRRMPRQLPAPRRSLQGTSLIGESESPELPQYER